MKESTVKHWDDHWKTRAKQTIHKLELDEISKLINLKSKKVLEIGAGSGVDSLYLCEKYKIKAYCLDYSKQSIDYIKETFKKKRKIRLNQAIRRVKTIMDSV